VLVQSLVRSQSNVFKRRYWLLDGTNRSLYRNWLIDQNCRVYMYESANPMTSSFNKLLIPLSEEKKTAQRHTSNQAAKSEKYRQLKRYHIKLKTYYAPLSLQWTHRHKGDKRSEQNRSNLLDKGIGLQQSIRSIVSRIDNEIFKNGGREVLIFCFNMKKLAAEAHRMLSKYLWRDRY